MAPLDDGDRPPASLQDLYNRAKNHALPRGLAWWVFAEAKAKGRRELAAIEIKRLDTDLAAISYRAAMMETTAAYQLVQTQTPYERIQRANVEYVDASEAVAVCERMIQILTGNPTTKGP